ncbi:MAG: hypothetical protein ACYDHD_01660 [Vulcanimicrobiaceae bacterium]
MLDVVKPDIFHVIIKTTQETGAKPVHTDLDQPLTTKMIPPSKAFQESTGYRMQQRVRTLRASVLKTRDQIPWVFGPSTYVYTVIAANGGVIRETDLQATLGENAVRSSKVVGSRSLRLAPPLPDSNPTKLLCVDDQLSCAS